MPSDNAVPHEPTLADMRILLGQIQAAERALEPEHVISLCETALTQLELISPGAARDALQDAVFTALFHAHERLKQFGAAADAIRRWQERTQSSESVIDAQNSLAQMLSHQGDFEAALRVVEEAASQAEACAYLPGLGHASRMQANLHWILGQFDQAYLLAQQALTIAEQSEDLMLEARTRSSLGVIEQARGNYYAALQQSARSAEIFGRLDDRYRQASEYSNLGEHYQVLYDMENALHYHQRARAMLGEDMVSYDLDRNLAVDLIGVGRIREGLEQLKTILEAARAQGERDVYCQVLNSLGEAYMQLGNAAAAREMAEELLAEAERSDSTRHKVRALYVLGLSIHADGDVSSAHDLLYEAFTLAQTLGDINILWQTRAALATILRKRQPIMARIHHRIARENVQGIAAAIKDLSLRATFEQAEPVRALLNEKL